MSTGRTRHKLIKTQSKKKQSKKRKRKDGTNSDVLGMTDVFLQEEGKQGLDHDNLINSTSASPVPNDKELDDFLATFNFDPNEELPESKGGRRRRKSKRKTRKKRKERGRRKRKTRRRKMRKTKRKRGGAEKNFKKNLLHNIEKKEKRLKPMINSIISKYYKGKEKISYSILKKVIENSDNKVLEKIGKEVKEITVMKNSVMKGGADDEESVIPFAITSLAFCFIVCFMLYVLLSFFDSELSRFYIMSQGGYQQIVERRGWREADNEISRNIKKIKREIVFLVFLMCTKFSVNNYYEAQERMRQFRLLSPLQQQRVMIEHQERINRQNAELERMNEELDEVRDFWDRIRGSTNLNRNLDVRRMIRDIHDNRNIDESKGEGKE